MIHTTPLAPMPMSRARPGITIHRPFSRRKMLPASFTTQGLPHGSTAMRTAPPSM
jgi:hypothetical protein